MKIALMILMALAANAAGEGYAPSPDEISTERWHAEEAYELVLKPTGRDALTKTKEAFELARTAGKTSDADAAALKALARAYNAHVNPSLHHLRNLISRAIHGFDSLNMACLTIDANSRLGKKSIPVSRNDPILRKPGNFGPARPAERKLMMDLRVEASSYGVQSHAQLEKARGLLAGIDTVAVSSSVAAAVRAMDDAVSVSSEAVSGWLAFLEDGGKYVVAVDAYQRYLEAANAALAPVPDERKEAIRNYNTASKEFARLEFMVGDDIMIGRNIDKWLDDLGPLEPPR